MKKPTIRRLLAYIVDIVVISLIASALAKVSFLNPYYDEYNEVEERYQEIIDEASQDGTKLNELLNGDGLNDLTYEMSKSGVFVSIYTVILSVLYFVVFQYFTKGKTLGKKLLRIEIVSNDKTELKFVQLIKRSIIINSIITSTISIILIMAVSKKSFLSLNRYVQLLEIILVFLSAGFALYREDGRGLHDLFAGTRVIVSADKEFFLKHDEVKEAEIVTEEKEVKKKTTKKRES